MAANKMIVNGHLDQVAEILKKGIRKNNYTKNRWLHVEGKALSELEVLLTEIRSLTSN